MAGSFLFYDLETFGADPRRSRIAQFAAVRTTPALDVMEEPLSFFVQPADDIRIEPAASHQREQPTAGIPHVHFPAVTGGDQPRQFGRVGGQFKMLGEQVLGA